MPHGADATCGVLRSWLNNIGLLKLVLRDANDLEVHVSSLLTQIVRARLAGAVACHVPLATRALTAALTTQTKTPDGFMRRFVSPL